jgi:hypothetical protein
MAKAKKAKTITTAPLDEDSLSFVNGTRWRPFWSRIEGLSVGQLRGSVVNLAAALATVRAKLERDYGITLDLRGVSPQMRRNERKTDRKMRAAGGR